MRNTWKGLVVGGLTGIAGGAVLDIVGRASGRARRIGESAKDHAPEAASWIRHVADRAAERIQEADVKGHAHDVAQRVQDAAGRFDSSEVAGRIASAAKDVAKGASHTATDVSHGAKEAARGIEDVVGKHS